jgi:hypothetical protein
MQNISRFAPQIRFAILEVAIVVSALYGSRRLKRRLDVLEEQLDQKVSELESMIPKLERWRG